MTYPTKKLTIVGGGIIAAMRVYYAYQNTVKQLKKTHEYADQNTQTSQLRVTIHEKNQRLN